MILCSYINMVQSETILKIVFLPPNIQKRQTNGPTLNYHRMGPRDVSFPPHQELLDDAAHTEVATQKMREAQLTEEQLLLGFAMFCMEAKQFFA